MGIDRRDSCQQDDRSHHKQAQKRRIDLERQGQTRHDARNHLVLRVAVETVLTKERVELFKETAYRVLSALLLRGIGFLSVLLPFVEQSAGCILFCGTFLSHLLRASHASYDLLHMIYIDSLHALALQFLQQLGDAFLEVVGNLAAVGLTGEVVAQRVYIVAEQFVSVFVDIEEPSAKINRDILFHNCFIY